MRPLRSLTGTIDFAKRPSSHARAARSCDRTANRSTSSRLTPSIVAIRSAPIPCGTKFVSNAVCGSIAIAPPSVPMGTRDMDSTPPAMIMSSMPERIRAAAWFTDSSPEPQNRLSCTPATLSGRPATIDEIFAISAPWSPTGVTQPRTTSSTRPGS